MFAKAGLSARVLVLLALLPLLVMFGCSSSDSSSDPENHAPSITSVTVVPGAVGAGGTATVTVSASDVDGDTITYSYNPNGGAITGSGSVVQWTAPMTAGTYSVTVTVTDEHGATTNANGTLTVSAAVTGIAGTVALPGGVPGDLGNGNVSIYVSWNDWVNYQPAMTVTVVGTGSSVSYSLTNVPPGTYWIDYWLDNDFDSWWSSGDFVAWHGSGTWGAPTLTPFTVAQGQTVNINMTAVLIP
jgi:hypothetical protein